MAFEQLLEHVTTTAFRPFPTEQQVARVLFRDDAGASVRPALEDSAQAATLDPTFADAFLLQGLALAVLSQQTEAITAYTHALALDYRAVFAHAQSRSGASDTQGL